MRTILAAAAFAVALSGPAGAESKDWSPPQCNETWIGGLISNSREEPGKPHERVFVYFRRADIAAVSRHFIEVGIFFKPGTVSPERQYIHGTRYTGPFLRCLLGE